MKYLLVYIAFCLMADMMYVGYKLVRALREGQTKGPEGESRAPSRVPPETESERNPKE